VSFGPAGVPATGEEPRAGAETVVGKPPSHLVEGRVPGFERFEKSGKFRAVHSAGTLEVGDPLGEGGGVVHTHGAVRAEGRINLRTSLPAQGGVVGKVVGRVVGRAKDPHVRTFDQLAGGKSRPRQQFVGTAPDSLRRCFVQQVVNPEKPQEFEVRPVVKRVAKRMGHRPGKGKELLVGRRIAGTKFFGDAVGAHGAPLVVVACQPNLRKVVKPPVLRDVGGGQVAVVIVNRLLLGVIVVEALGGVGVEEEVVVDERFHGWRRRRLILGSPGKFHQPEFFRRG